jgi:putative transport protein
MLGLYPGAMVEVLADNPVLTLFLVVGLGSALGPVPSGPIRFGPAGALFVGLALGAVDDRLGEDLGLARTIGLACSCTPSGCRRARS